MAEVPLTPEQFRQLVHLTATRAGILTPVDRQNLLELAGLNEFAPRLDFGSNAQTFGQQLIRTLQEYGTLQKTGQPALVSLLWELHQIVGGREDEAAFVVSLLAPYEGKISTLKGGKRLKVFVSYRRKSWAFTHRMAGDLKQHLDADIFVDISGMDQVDFETSILSHLRGCDVVLLVVSDYTFSERIHNADDWVRREIALALQLCKPIVLIAVEGLFPPDAASLPADIRGVTRMQGIKFYPEFWDAALKQLAEFVPKAAVSPIPDCIPAPETPHKSPLPMDAKPSQPTSITPPPTADSARDLQRAIDLLNDERFADALPLLEAMDKAQYRPHVVAPMLRQARLDEAEYAPRLETERQVAQHRAHYQNIYDEIAMIAQNKRTLEQARQEWTQFVRDTPNWREILGSDPANLTALQDPPKSRFTLPLLEWINIPAGWVTLEDDAAMHTIEPFTIAKYPVTYAQFQVFIEDGGYREDRYWKDLAQRESAPQTPSWTDLTHPRETVNWFEAMAFTRWLAEKTGRAVTLPTEMQWQWAAIGDKRWTYPYGSKFDKTKSNTSESGIQQTTPVDRYPQGVSPFGVMDLSGNVWEWCLNEYSNIDSNSLSNMLSRSLRGGSWFLGSDYARASSRSRSYAPGYCSSDFGFRLVCSASVTKP